MRWQPISDTNPLVHTFGLSTDQNNAPTARWTSVPMQLYHDGDTVRASVVAFHKSGIDRVEFICDGGEDVDGPHRIVVSSPVTNIITKQDEYSCALVINSIWTEGIHTIRAVVYPLLGGPRVLQGTWLPKSDVSDTSYEYSVDGEVDFSFIVNRGSFGGATLWVDSVSGSDTNDGNFSSPFKNLWAAIERIHSGSSVGLISEDKIICKPGRYRMSPLTDANWLNGYRPDNILLGSGRIGWLRIESDTSAGRNNVVITNEPNNFGSITTPTVSGKPNEIFTRFVHIKNIKVENANHLYPNVSGNKNNIFIVGDSENLDRRGLWIDECIVSSSSGVSSADIVIANNDQPDISLMYYPEICNDMTGFITSSSIYSLYNGLRNFVLARQVGLGDIVCHATIDCPCILSCNINNVGDYGSCSLASCIYSSELSIYKNNIIIAKNTIENSSIPHFRIETSAQSSGASATSYSVRNIAIVSNYFTNNKANPELPVPNNSYIFNGVKDVLIYHNSFYDNILFHDIPGGTWQGQIHIDNIYMQYNLLSSIKIESSSGSIPVNTRGANEIISKINSGTSVIDSNIFLAQGNYSNTLALSLVDTYGSIKSDFSVHPIVKNYKYGDLTLNCYSVNGVQNPAKRLDVATRLKTDSLGNSYENSYADCGSRRDCTADVSLNTIAVEKNTLVSGIPPIAGFPIIGSSASDWYQGSNYAVSFQNGPFDFLYWYAFKMDKIPGAVFLDSTCQVNTLGPLIGQPNYDPGTSEFFTISNLSGLECGAGTPATLAEVRAGFRARFDADKIVKSLSRYRPDWIEVFIKGASEPLPWATNIPGLRQWALLADDGLTETSIGMAFDLVAEYVAVSNKYKQRLIAYFSIQFWAELDPAIYPFVKDIFGRYVVEARHGDYTRFRSICNDAIVSIIGDMHVELAQHGMDRNTGYGICGAMWDEPLLTQHLDFCDDAKIASGIDTSLDFPWPVVSGPLFDYTSQFAFYGNVASILIQPVTPETALAGWTQPVKDKLEQYMYAMSKLEGRTMKKIRDKVDAAGYPDFAILPAVSQNTMSIEFPGNGQETVVYSSGSKAEIGIENYKHRKQVSGNTNRENENALPDMWLAQHIDSLTLSGITGKRLFSWQIGQFVIPSWINSGDCGTSIYNSLGNFDNLYGSSVEYQPTTLPRECAVRGWLENQSLLCLASHTTIQFMYSLADWWKYDQPEDLDGFNDVDTNYHIAHFPYMRRVFSILGSIKDSNVALSNRRNVVWCIILNKWELTWRGGTYNINYASHTFSIIWPMIGATRTCVENGIPHAIVEASSFTSAGFSNAGVVIVPFLRANTPASVMQELSKFQGLVIWLEDVFPLVDEIYIGDDFHNTVDNDGITNAQISRNLLWTKIQEATRAPSIKTDFVIPSNLYEAPVPLVGYEIGTDSYGNESVVATIAADVSWHDPRKGYLFNIDWNNGPAFETQYCGRQNLLFYAPNSNVRIEEVTGLRQILDIGGCADRDCFYIDYIGPDPIPLSLLPAQGQLVFYAGYPPTYSSFREATITFNCAQKPYRARQLLMNSYSGRFDPIDIFMDSNALVVNPFEMGTIIQFQLSDRSYILPDLGICVSESLVMAQNASDLGILFNELANQSASNNLITVRMKCGSIVEESNFVGSILFSQIKEHISSNPESYSWVASNVSGIATPSDQIPIGFLFSDTSSCVDGFVSISGIILQNEGVCDIAVNIPLISGMATAIAGQLCSCSDSRPDKIYTSRGIVSLDYSLEDGAPWVELIENELSALSNQTNGLMLFIKPVVDEDNPYYNLDDFSLPYYRGIVNYLQDIDDAISDYSSGDSGINEYYQGVIIDFNSVFNVNENAPHPKYCAYPYLIETSGVGAMTQVKKEIARVNGAYIAVIKEIKNAFPDMRVSVRGVGKFGDGTSLQSDSGDPVDYTILSATPSVRKGLERRISESYGPILETCDFIYVENQNINSGDTLSSVLAVTNASIGAIRNHFLCRNTECPPLYLEINGVHSNDSSINSSSYCKVADNEFVTEGIVSFFRYGINGFVYYDIQEYISDLVVGSCPSEFGSEFIAERITTCWNLFLTIDPDLLSFAPLRYPGIGSPTIQLNESEIFIDSNRIKSSLESTPYEYEVVRLTNAQLSTITMINDIFYFASGLDHNYPNLYSILASGFEYPDGLGNDGAVLAQREVFLADLNSSYTYFVNDPWPNTEFSETLASSDKIKQKKPIYQKYPVYDENNNIVIDVSTNTCSLSKFEGYTYINDSNHITYTQSGKIKAYPSSALYPDANFNKSFQLNSGYVLQVVMPILQLEGLDSFAPQDFYARSIFDFNISRLNEAYHIMASSLELGTRISQKLPPKFNDHPWFNLVSTVGGLTKHVEFVGDQYSDRDKSIRLLSIINRFNGSDVILNDEIDQSYSYDPYDPYDSEALDSFFPEYQDFFKNYINDLDENGVLLSNSNLSNSFNSSGTALPLFDHTRAVTSNSGLRDFILNKPNIRSISTSSNCMVAIDENGSITVTYGAIPYCAAFLNQYDRWGAGDYRYLYDWLDPLIIHYNKEEVENNFWVDRDGLVSYLENKDFISAEIYGSPSLSLGAYVLTYVMALHSSGKVYARELSSGVAGLYEVRIACKIENQVSLIEDIIDLNVGDEIFISFHDTQELAGPMVIGDKGVSVFRIVYLEKETGLCVFQEKDGYYGPGINPNRPYRIYRGDIFAHTSESVDSQYRIKELYFERILYHPDVVPADPFQELDSLPDPNPANFYHAYTSEGYYKIDPIINGLLNPEFLSANLKYHSPKVYTDLNADVVVVNGTDIYVSNYDPHKKIYKWLDDSTPEIVDITPYIFISSTGIIKMLVARPNGILQAMQTMLQQIDIDSKVVKIFNNNAANDLTKGSRPAFVIKNKEQPNTLVEYGSNSFYSYSYEILVADCFGSFIFGDPFINSDNFKVLSKYVNNKVFGLDDEGYYTQTGWETVPNPNFNESIYNKFIYKNIESSQSDSHYYSPIRCASFGFKSMCLLNNDNECLVINGHTTPFLGGAQSKGWKNAVKSSVDFSTSNDWYITAPAQQYWLYNRGSGHQYFNSTPADFAPYSLTPGMPYNAKFHRVTFEVKNIYANLNSTEVYTDPFVYLIEDNSLVSPVIHEETIYGLGNPPSSAEHPFGIGMDIQQLESFKTFTYTGEESYNDFSKDTHYIEVLDYVNFNEEISGNDLVLFRTTQSAQSLSITIDFAVVHDKMLHIMLSNGVLDIASMARNIPSPVTYRNVDQELITYYGFKSLEYFTAFSSYIYGQPISAVVPSHLRTPVILQT